MVLVSAMEKEILRVPGKRALLGYNKKREGRKPFALQGNQLLFHISQSSVDVLSAGCLVTVNGNGVFAGFQRGFCPGIDGMEIIGGRIA